MLTLSMNLPGNLVELRRSAGRADVDVEHIPQSGPKDLVLI